MSGTPGGQRKTPSGRGLSEQLSGTHSPALPPAVPRQVPRLRWDERGAVPSVEQLLLLACLAVGCVLAAAPLVETAGTSMATVRCRLDGAVAGDATAVCGGGRLNRSARSLFEAADDGIAAPSSVQGSEWDDDSLGNSAGLRAPPRVVPTAQAALADSTEWHASPSTASASDSLSQVRNSPSPVPGTEFGEPERPSGEIPGPVAQDLGARTPSADLPPLPEADQKRSLEQQLIKTLGLFIVRPVSWRAPEGSQRFGAPRAPRWVNGKRQQRFHEGADYAAPRGTPVVAPIAGRVTTRGWQRKPGGPSNGWDYAGNSVIVETDEGLRPKVSLFHLDAFDASLHGREVTAGVSLGKVGNTGDTGKSSKPAYDVHLHAEVHLNGIPIDPELAFGLSEGRIHLKEFLERLPVAVFHKNREVFANLPANLKAVLSEALPRSVLRYFPGFLPKAPKLWWRR